MLRDVPNIAVDKFPLGSPAGDAPDPPIPYARLSFDSVVWPAESEASREQHTQLAAGLAGIDVPAAELVALVAALDFALVLQIVLAAMPATGPVVVHAVVPAVVGLAAEIAVVEFAAAAAAEAVAEAVAAEPVRMPGDAHIVGDAGVAADHKVTLVVPGKAHLVEYPNAVRMLNLVDRVGLMSLRLAVQEHRYCDPGFLFQRDCAAI